MAHPLQPRFQLGLRAGPKIVSPVLTILLSLMAGLGTVVAMIEGWPGRDGLYFAFAPGLSAGFGALIAKASRACVPAISTGS